MTLPVQSLFFYQPLVQTLGVSGIVGGLAPTPEWPEWPEWNDATRDYYKASASLASLIYNGSPLPKLLDQQRLAASALRILEHSERETLRLAVAGWEESANTALKGYFERYPKPIGELMLSVQLEGARLLSRLGEFVALPYSNMAADLPANGNSKKVVDWVVGHLVHAGFVTEVVKTEEASPLVAGFYNGHPEKKTVYFVVNYDVPFPSLEGRSELYEAHVLGYRLYGSGVNAKAAFLAFVEAARRGWINAVILAQGEKEIGSPHAAELLEKIERRLKSMTPNVIVVANPISSEADVPRLYEKRGVGEASSRAADLMAQAFQQGYGRESVSYGALQRVNGLGGGFGGALATMFPKVPFLELDYGDEGSNIHTAGESLSIPNFVNLAAASTLFAASLNP